MKLNARILRGIGLINFGKGMNAKLTMGGKLILSAIKNEMEAKNGK